MAGAGIDVFESEPMPADNPLTGMDNVILSPHNLAWTDELYRLNGEHACDNVLTVLRGEIPKYPVNRAVLDRPAFRQKLADLRARWEQVIAGK